MTVLTVADAAQTAQAAYCEAVGKERSALTDCEESQDGWVRDKGNSLGNGGSRDCEVPASRRFTERKDKGVPWSLAGVEIALSGYEVGASAAAGGRPVDTTARAEAPSSAQVFSERNRHGNARIAANSREEASSVGQNGEGREAGEGQRTAECLGKWAARSNHGAYERPGGLLEDHH